MVLPVSAYYLFLVNRCIFYQDNHYGGAKYKKIILIVHFHYYFCYVLNDKVGLINHNQLVSLQFINRKKLVFATNKSQKTCLCDL